MWISASVAWARRQWPDQLVSIVLHIDQQTPHLHVLVVPRVRDGKSGWKLNSKALFDRQRFRDMQPSYAVAVQHLRIRRGEPGSNAKHSLVKQFYGAVNASSNTPSRPRPPPRPKPPQVPSGAGHRIAHTLMSALGLETQHQRALNDHHEAVRNRQETVKDFREQEKAAWDELKARAALAPLLRRRASPTRSAGRVLDARPAPLADRPKHLPRPR
jgi:Plasmid recombination enzyme